MSKRESGGTRHEGDALAQRRLFLSLPWLRVMSVTLRDAIAYSTTLVFNMLQVLVPAVGLEPTRLFNVPGF